MTPPLVTGWRGSTYHLFTCYMMRAKPYRVVDPTTTRLRPCKACDPHNKYRAEKARDAWDRGQRPEGDLITSGPIPRRRVGERLVDDVVEAIRDEPDASLASLARSLGTSRRSIREAVGVARRDGRVVHDYHPRLGRILRVREGVVV